MEREEIRFGCIERAMALTVRFGKGDAMVLAETFYRFVGEDPNKLQALEVALTAADRKGTAARYVELAAEVMEFVNRRDASGASDTPVCV